MLCSEQSNTATVEMTGIIGPAERQARSAKLQQEEYNRQKVLVGLSGDAIKFVDLFIATVRNEYVKNGSVAYVGVSPSTKWRLNDSDTDRICRAIKLIEPRACKMSIKSRPNNPLVVLKVYFNPPLS